MAEPFFQAGQLREDIDFEAKLAAGRDGKGKLPESFFETYSAFANTGGGVVLLGLKELDHGKWEVKGILEPDNVIADLWAQLNNPDKVSCNLLQTNHVNKHELQKGHWLAEIEVPRASRKERPVYLKKNPLTGTYKRQGEGDFRCSQEEVRRMLAEQTEDARDARILENFTFDDLELETFRAYRTRLTAVKPDHPYNSEENLEFLRKIGGWNKDRPKGVEGLTLAGLLMFGKLEAIQEAMPYYFVDYREVLDERSATEWVDRITPDGTWSGNLYDFYRLTIQRLFNGLKIPFELKGDERQDDTPLHKALREALVNTIIHADYSAPVATLVVKGPSYFGFRNPGKMRIPVDQALQGGTSDSRNRNIQKMFSLINLGEQAGSGIPRVVENWKSQHFRIPELWERDEPESTWMRLRMVSLLPKETLEELRRLFGTKFDKLNENERLALATSHIESFVTNARIQQVCDLHSHDITTLLKGLVKQGFLEQDGKARGTTYRLQGMAPIDLARSEDLVGRSLDLDGRSIGKSASSIGKEQGSIGYNLSSLDKETETWLFKISEVIRSKKHAKKEAIEETISKLCLNRFLTLHQIASFLGRSEVDLRQRFIKPMIENRTLIRRFPDRPNHEQQAYRTRQDDE